jgi:hypothetical protein
MAMSAPTQMRLCLQAQQMLVRIEYAQQKIAWLGGMKSKTSTLISYEWIISQSVQP